MRAILMGTIAAFAISLTSQATEAAPAQKQQHARTIQECLRLANARGWTTRAGDRRDRRRFLRGLHAGPGWLSSSAVAAEDPASRTSLRWR
jgi:hypothetical protein